MFVHVPSRRREKRAWWTLAIVLACTLVFGWEMLLPEAQRAASLYEFGTVPSRLAQAFSQTHLLPIGRELLRLLSGIFVHVDFPHLLGNMVFVLIFGLSAERLLGSRRFLALYLICGAFANLCGAFIYQGSEAVIVGSSGAVSAIVGAYITLFPNARLGLVIPLGLFMEWVRMPASILIGVWVLIQVLFALAGPNLAAVAWPVHLAGFVSGVVFALLARPGIAKRLRNS